MSNKTTEELKSAVAWVVEHYIWDWRMARLSLTEGTHCKTFYYLFCTGSTQKDGKSSRHNWKIVDWYTKNEHKFLVSNIEPNAGIIICMQFYIKISWSFYFKTYACMIPLLESFQLRALKLGTLARCICTLFAISEDISCALSAISIAHYFRTPIRSYWWLVA